MSVLSLQGVSAFYGGAQVLDGVDLEVEEGESVGLVGRNGAGKTTTLLSIFGVPRVEGVIAIDGTPVGRHGYEPASRGVSLVPQGKGIFPNLTVRENIVLGQAAGRRGEWTVERVFDLFPNLARGANRPGDRLSGGEQQMLAIARALMSDPRLLLLDEPTEGLAPVVIDELVEVLRVIQGLGTAMILVEQRIGMIRDLTSRFVALSKGEVVATGTAEDLDSPEVRSLIAV